jgi:hypothetical protein
MAGAGVKLFLSGEIAYAADINQYLMDQSVSLFLNEAARNSAFGNGIPITQAGGDGKPLLTAGRICFLLEAAGSTVGNPIRTIQYYDGSTWVDSGQFTVPDGAVTSAKLNAGVAGSGLSGGAGTALAVNVDDSTIEINSDTLRLKDAGITSAKLASAVAGNGLSGGAGTALAVNVDDSTVEINADALRVKDAGITSAKLASAVAGNGLSGGAGTALAVNVDGSTIEINSDTLRVKDLGITSGKLESNLVLAGNVTGNPAAGTVSTGTSGFGYMGLPQNATTTGSYTVLAADAGKHIYSTATRTITIPANATTAMPVGSTLVFIAGSGATVTIAITSDTLYLAGPGSTGSRTLAAFGMATAVKITATSWIISGNGLT